MDTFVGTDTAYGEARPALACTGDTRRKRKHTRGTPCYLLSAPCPLRRLRQTGGYVRVPPTPPPLGHSVSLAVYLPAPAVEGMSVDSPRNADNVDMPVRPLETK